MTCACGDDDECGCIEYPLFQEPMVDGGNLNLKWTDCGDSSYHAKVKALSPTVLPIGQKTTITGSGNVDEQVTGGAFTITAKFGVTEHYSGDVCSSKVIKLPLGVGTITWEGLKCPVAKGDVSVAVNVSLSRLIPAKLAKGTIEIKAAGASKENLICLDIDTSAATQTLPQPAIAPIVQPNPRPGPIHFKCQPLGFHCSSNNDCCSKVCETDPAIKPFARCQDAPPMFEAGGSLSFQEPMVEGGNLNLKWTDCGDSSYHAKVKALAPTLLPIGQKTTITGSGNVDEQVTAGAFTITAKFGTTEHYSGDVCSSKVIKLPLGIGTITWEGLKCP